METDVSHKTDNTEENPTTSVSKVLDSTASAEGKKKRPPPDCRFFNTPGGCQKGEKCRFLHVPKENLRTGSNKEDAPKEPKKNFLKEKKFKPIIPVKIILKKEQLASDEQKSARSSELAYFKRRYRNCVISSRENAGTSISFKYMITEPDWPFDVKGLSLCIELDEGHPIIPPLLTISADKNRQLPEVLRKHIERTMSDAIASKYKIFADRNFYEIIGKALIHWIDRNVLSMFVDGLRKQKLTVQAESAGISLVLPKSEGGEVNKNEDETPKEAEENVSGLSAAIENVTINESVSTEEENEQNGSTISSGAIAAPHPPPQELPIKISLVWNNVSQKIASLSPVTLLLIVRCARCKEERQQEIPAKGYRECRCPKCAVVQTIRSQPEIVHENSSLLARLDCRGCRPIDLVLMDCTLRFVCFECNTEDFVQKVNYGQHHKSWCKTCHNLCELVISVARFSGDFSKCVAAGNPCSALPKAPKPKVTVTSGISPGHPLPDNGTCKHYKKSYRWFRFPCCGRVFPCDTCHEEANLGHEMKVANRMICGHCSTEQPLTGSKAECKECSQNVVRSRSTFWEGGKGCRDKTVMNKNDVHKFVNSKKKTAPRRKAADPK